MIKKLRLAALILIAMFTWNTQLYAGNWPTFKIKVINNSNQPISTASDNGVMLPKSHTITSNGQYTFTNSQTASTATISFQVCTIPQEGGCLTPFYTLTHTINPNDPSLTATIICKTGKDYVACKLKQIN